MSFPPDDRASAELVDAGIELLAFRVRLEVVRALHLEGPAMRRELAERLGVSPALLQRHLAVLERLAVVSLDPPRRIPNRRRRRYVLDAGRVRRLLEAVAAAALPEP